MLIRKIWTGTMTAVAVVAIASWASVASAALPEDVAAALSADNTPAQQQAAIQALATANAGNAEAYTELVQLVAAGVSQEQAAAFAGALAAACGASGNNAQTTQILVNGMAGQHPEAGGAIVGQVISGGCSAEVAASTLQSAIESAVGAGLRQRVEVLKNPGPGTGVEDTHFDVKSKQLTRLGSPGGEIFPTTFQEGAMSPTSVKDKAPEPPIDTGETPQ